MKTLFLICFLLSFFNNSDNNKKINNDEILGVGTNIIQNCDNNFYKKGQSIKEIKKIITENKDLCKNCAYNLKIVDNILGIEGKNQKNNIYIFHKICKK